MTSGKKPSALHSSSDAARQEREALEVVGVALGRRTVEVRAVEVAVVLEAVDRDVAAGKLADAHARARAAPPHRHGHEAVEHLEVVPRHARVERHHDAHVDAQRAQRLGQRARDVGQPARLRERRALGGDEQNL